MATPTEVLSSLSSELKKKKITRAQVAEALGYKSVQTVANLLASRAYLNSSQANTLNESFGFSVDYLTKGIGTIDGKPVTSEAIEEHVHALEALEIQYSFLLNRFDEIAHIYNDDTLREINDKLTIKKDILFMLLSKKEDSSFPQMVNSYTCDIDFSILEKMKQLAEKHHSTYPIGTKPNCFIL